MKTHRKKQEPQAIMYINASTKKHNKQSPNKPLTARTTPPTSLPTNKAKQKNTNFVKQKKN